MSDKTAPLGTCDHCGGEIPRNRWYTSKRKPRRYCCLDCRNTANSRVGAPIRSAKQREYVRRGRWVNPASIRAPLPENVGRGVSRSKKRAVREGRWKNPALGTEAREKLSRPRKHSGALASAIEKLRQGARIADLTAEEQEAHRAWRRDLARTRREKLK